MKNMVAVRKSTLGWMVALTMLLSVFMATAVFFWGHFLKTDLLGLAPAGADAVSREAIEVRMEWLLHRSMLVAFPLFFCVTMLGALALRGIILRSAPPRATSPDLSTEKEDSAATPSPPSSGGAQKTVDSESDRRRERRIFLQLLAAFQREGRFVDFLAEDLSSHADDQIGAAVRSIHENCRRVMARHLDLAPVCEREEGEPIVLEEGFDIDAFKLTGNVKGDPPFEGIVRHRGWRNKKWNMPDFPDGTAPGLIQPAEIEIR